MGKSFLLRFSNLFFFNWRIDFIFSSQTFYKLPENFRWS